MTRPFDKPSDSAFPANINLFVLFESILHCSDPLWNDAFLQLYVVPISKPNGHANSAHQLRRNQKILDSHNVYSDFVKTLTVL